MPYALGQLHNCHHIPPSLPSVPPILTPNPPPHLLGRGGGGGVNNNLSIFSFPPPQFPWEPPPPPRSPPPPKWGGSTIFFIGFWTVHDISRTFYFDPLTPPPGCKLIFLGILCQCISDETLKAVGPFYLVSMPGEVKDPTSPHWNV